MSSTRFEAGHDSPSDDEIESQHSLQMLHGFELAPLHFAAALKDPVPFFDTPAPTVPLHLLPRLLSVGYRQVGQEHPINGLLASRRLRFVDPDSPELKGRPAFFASDPGSLDCDRAPAYFHRRLSSRLSMVARKIDGACVSQG